ncbi:hypothetical protein, partial [Bosea sp. (in: a-proteobacteria)]|uniref:hypothetical protein n=1 Tax=Bosea sp. (in: a-proteobacteria) TaxID=1871050 RepID=UPI003F71555B
TLVTLWVMTLILWRGGDPFADEFTLGEEAGRRCSGGNRAGSLALQSGATGLISGHGVDPSRARVFSLSTISRLSAKASVDTVSCAP